MSIPITPEDFIAIGERYLSEDIIEEIDRLLPLATADITRLATRGYGEAELSKLEAFRTLLVTEVAGRKQQRGSKKGSRSVEAHAVKGCARSESGRVRSESGRIRSELGRVRSGLRCAELELRRVRSESGRAASERKFSRSSMILSLSQYTAPSHLRPS